VLRILLRFASLAPLQCQDLGWHAKAAESGQSYDDLPLQVAAIKNPANVLDRDEVLGVGLYAPIENGKYGMKSCSIEAAIFTFDMKLEPSPDQ
jgi:hypothetical protein